MTNKILDDYFEFINGNPSPVEQKRYITNLIYKVEKQAITDFMKEVKNIDIKDHACRFNDGEYNCDCYIAGIKVVKDLAKKYENTRDN